MADRKITQHPEMLQADFHDNDVVEIVDIDDTSDAPSGTNKKTKWSTIKATLKAYFDTFYSTFSGSYNDLSGKPTLGTAAAQDVGAFATATQGGKADSAVQPGDLGAVATSNDYNDLDNLPDLSGLSNLPSATEKAALGGTNGTPSGTNPYVTNTDGRMTNARTPTAHSHPISDVTGLQTALDGKASTGLASGSADGLMSSSDFTKLEDIEANADKTDADNVKSAIDGTSAKGSIVDSDEIVILDSAASNNIKTVLWSVIKTAIAAIHALKGAIGSSGLTMTTGKLLGRSTASTGAIEEITIGSGLSLSGGVLSVPGGGGGGSVKIFKVRKNADQTISSATDTTVTFQTTDYDTSGVVGSSVITIPNNEVWLLTARIQWKAAGSNVTTILKFVDTVTASVVGEIYGPHENRSISGSAGFVDTFVLQIVGNGNPLQLIVNQSGTSKDILSGSYTALFGNYITTLP